MSQYKVCSKCKLAKSLDSFSTDKQKISGLRSNCRACDKARLDASGYGKTYYQNNRETRLAKEAQRRAQNREQENKRSRKWKQENKERCRVVNAAWNRNNRERAHQNATAWRKANPERNRDNQNRWRKENPDKQRAKEVRRRTAHRANGVYFISNAEIKRLYSSPCFYCQDTKDITLDHIIPISRGGSHSIGNLLPACRSCNLSKNAKTITEWRMWQKRNNKLR
jgi:5-methylcytosine-specific restriction endonuclease McrA